MAPDRTDARRLLLVLSAGWFALQVGRLAVSPLLPTISGDLGLSPTAAGAVVSVLWGAYALAQYPGGRFSDALSPPTVLVPSLCVLVVGFAGLSVANGLPVLVGSAAVVGVGAGLFPSTARTHLGDVFAGNEGRALGLHIGAGDVGGVVAAGLAALVVAHADWHLAFAPVALALACCAWALHRVRLREYVRATVSLDVLPTARRVLGDADVRLLLAAYTLYAFVWEAIAGFLPTFLRVGKGYSPLVASVGFAVLFGAGAIVKPTAGELGDRFPRYAVAPATLLLGAFAVALVVVAPAPIVAVIGVLLVAAGVMAYSPVMQAYLMSVFPDDSTAGDFGMLRTIYLSVGALGSTYVGFVAEHASYALAFWGLAACLVAAAALVVIVAQRSRP
ncbi:hypothetical protein MBEHAL_1542 [Halarchaeum acidiphilum MH1-52-1]|uniref:Major facilitator superfamily (MFS) profile domain-containing protein n=1 Tax=Halarchaeum acidiphilum MH1-52-1 TaxID=1261545 RepID=U2YVI8_9EURY|nr:MFS transporter [Halarchaeum acidiphilum]GAD52782.1 hypothetical protein MBEHAL_1542 [Halarchaeum acidiphilum MH1-52-1]